MSNSDNVATNCAGCGCALDESPSKAPEDREPCPRCGSMNRKFQASLGGTVALTGNVEVVVRPAMFQATAFFPQGTITVEQPLPTEVVTNALPIEMNLLEPDDKGQWVIDIGAFGTVGYAAVGKLDDVLTEAALWLKGLAQRWDRKLKEKDET